MKKFLFVLILGFAGMSFGSSAYQPGKLIDSASEETGNGAGRAQYEYCLAFEVGDITYITNYEGMWRWSYQPSDLVVGDSVEVRIHGNSLYLKRLKGNDLKVHITRRERGTPGKKSIRCGQSIAIH